ncbi:MAG: hypothetical protein ACREOJ_09835 [Gemmatimonadaceae bacterium]
MTDALTPIERKVYHYLLDFLSEHTYQPSVREIGRTFQIKSTKTVSEILQSIANKGFIERDPARSRGVRIIGLQASRRIMPVPVRTQLAHSHTPELAARPEHHITMDRRFLPDDTVFFARAANGGAPELGILNGDYVLVDPAAVPAPGDLVAERHGDAAVVRTMTHAPVASGALAESHGHHGVTTLTEEPVLGVVCGVFRPLYDAADGVTESAELE